MADTRIAQESRALTNEKTKLLRAVVERRVMKANSPNGSPELTEVERRADEILARHMEYMGWPDSGQYNMKTNNARAAVIEALSSKNELPSEIEGLVLGLGQARYVLRSVANGDNQKEVAAKAAEIVDEAAQAILSLQRRLDEVRRIVANPGPDFDQRLHAALNPKDTDTASTPLVTGRDEQDGANAADAAPGSHASHSKPAAFRPPGFDPISQGEVK